MSDYPHIPVLLNEVLQFARELPKVERYLDCTFGRGGHAQEVRKLNPNMLTFAFDRDEAAINYAQKNFQNLIGEGKLILHRENFMTHQWTPEEAQEGFDFILADLGVSSPQYDEAGRGFSFYEDGPLDMRMDQREELTAAEIINTYSESELMALFKDYGEHPNPWRVVQAILKDRKQEEFTRTMQLSGLIERVDGWRKKGSHPATKYFMALRLEVNQELSFLKQAIDHLHPVLRPGGRLAMISFHSLEDRIIKHHFKTLTNFGKILTKKVVSASEEELKRNPRARTAKLRVWERYSFDGENPQS